MRSLQFWAAVEAASAENSPAGIHSSEFSRSDPISEKVDLCPVLTASADSCPPPVYSGVFHSDGFVQGAGGGTVSGWQALAAQVLQEVSQDSEPSAVATTQAVTPNDDLSRTAKARPGYGLWQSPFKVAWRDVVCTGCPCAPHVTRDDVLQRHLLDTIRHSRGTRRGSLRQGL